MASPQLLYTTEDLHNAARRSNWDEVRLMVSAQPELVNEKYGGVTSLWWIVFFSAPEDLVLRCLHKATRDGVDEVDEDYNTWYPSILHRLAGRGYAEAIDRTCHISSSNVNLQNKIHSNTPLHILLQENHSFRVHQDAALSLLNAGADVDVKNENGLTPADVYKQNKCSEYNDTTKKQQKKEVLQLLHRKIIPVEILARGAEALKAFKEGLEEGEVEVNQGRNVVMGLERVGKSSTINSFLRKDFNPDEQITDAMATTKVCTQDAADETLWKETSHDHSGVAGIYEDALVDAMAKQVLEKEGHKADEATAGPTRVKHFFKSMKRSVKNVFSTSKGRKKMEVGRKQGSLVSADVAISQEKHPDMERKQEKQRETTKEEVPENIASKVEKRINVMKFTTEATSEWQTSGNDFIMNIWDFGGQPIYHVIQRIFLVSFAVVCVVFNLEDDLDAPAYVRDPTTGEMYQHRMTNLQFILYWIRSAYTNSRDSKLDDGQLSPPVILIGTHLGSLEGNEEEKQAKAQEIFDRIWQALEGKPYEAMVFSTIFAIENSLPFSKSNASNIMKQILKFAKKMVRRLPLKWLLVQQELQKLKEKHIYLPTTEVIALVDRCGVKYDTHRILLEYLHDLGEILYFPDDEALKDIIVLDLMRIVDMSKTIITVIDPKLIEPLLREAWKKLDSGILEERLLRHLWKKFNVSVEMFDFFVSLMQKFGLVCERKITKGERIFYVLSRLKPEHVDSSSAEDYGKRAVSIFHDFGDYLPDDLFQRGVTKFIERFQVEDCEPKLSYEHVELDIDEHHHVVLDVANIKHRRMFQTTIIRRKILNTDAEDAEPLPRVCKEVLSFLEAELKIFCQSGARGIELRMYIPCICEPNIRDAHMHIVRKFDKDVLPCGSNGMEMTRYLRLFGDNLPQQDLPQFQPALTQPEDLPQSQPAVTKPKGFVDDAIIVTVSEEMDLSWRRFGVCLGLKWYIVNRFYADDRQICKAVENMMTYWRSNISSERHQLKALCTALRQHRFNRLAFKFQVDVVTEQACTECFDDQDLLFICDDLRSGWRRLGVRLGLKWTDINDIADNNRHVKDSIMEALVTWRDGQSTNQMSIMINALRQQGLVPLAKRVCERHGYKDDFEVAANQMSPPQVLTQPRLAQECFDDQDLLFICDNLGFGWKTLGERLGLELTDINDIENNNKQVKDRIMETLVTWRDCQSTNQMSIMINALRQQGFVELAERVCGRHGYKNEFEVATTQKDLPQDSTQQRPAQEPSSEDFLQLLEDVSSWWKRHGNVNMLKVLLREFKDMISLTQIEEKETPRELFELLRGPGLISPSNIDVLIDAAVLAGLHGVEPNIKKNVPTFPGFDKLVISRFTEHRQNLIKFGRIISKDKKARIGNLYDLTNDQLADQWVLIFELEEMDILTAESKESFIKKLEDNGMKQEANALRN